MTAHEVMLLETGESFACRSGQSVLDGMVGLGCRGIPMGCRGGGCGICKVGVVSGTADRKVMSRSHVNADEELSGMGLACRMHPTSSLTLRFIGLIKRAVIRPLKPAHH